MVDISEKLLLQQIKEGKEKAFSVIFNKYWEKLFLYAFAILKDDEACKDIVQEIFVSLWNRSSELEITNLQAYLLKSTKYQVAKYIRDNKKYEEFQDLYENFNSGDSTDKPVEYKELSGIISGKIDNLPQKCKEVFKLSRLDGLSNKQISEKLNISVSTVENHINKAIRLLKQDLSEYKNIIPLIAFFILNV